MEVFLDEGEERCEVRTAKEWVNLTKRGGTPQARINLRVRVRVRVRAILE